MTSLASFSREPFDVRSMRAVLTRWPFGRGKGLLMRAFRRRLDGRSFVMTVEPGVIIPARLQDYVDYWVFVNGYDRQPQVRLSRDLVRPGDVVLDVGANIGLWAMGAAQRAGGSGSVHAFEPAAENYERLRAHVDLNVLRNVRCDRRGISDNSGSALIYGASNGNSGMASLVCHPGVDRPEPVELTTLDDYRAEQVIERVNFLKVDVEGAELQVFRGGAGVLSLPQAPVILFEAAEPLAARFGSSSSKVKSLLSEHGYGIYRYRRRALEPVPIDEPHAHEDLFAFKLQHFEEHPVLGALKR